MRLTIIQSISCLNDYVNVFMRDTLKLGLLIDCVYLRMLTMVKHTNV